MMTLAVPSVSAVVDDHIYIGNLPAATSLDTRTKLGITHILSVCPDYPSTGPHHLVIPVQDSEYENLLIHLPLACGFIQEARDKEGKVLVHCVMGVSRSATVVAAYLMKTRKLTRASAMNLIKQRRPQVHPNYGFTKQLDAFGECHYDPSPSKAAYTTWQRTHHRNVTQFLNSMFDTTEIIPDTLLLTSDFPSDPSQAEALLLDLDITHLLSLSPAQISVSAAAAALPSPSATHLHLHLPARDRDAAALLTALPVACEFVRRAVTVERRGRVLVHCLVESRACMVVCAYLMSSRKVPPSETYKILEQVLPLFNPTPAFKHHLELFAACKYAPSTTHPLVQAWRAQLDDEALVVANGGITNGAQSTINGAHPQSKPYAPKNPKGDTGTGIDMGAAAALALSDTGLDYRAFGDALARIQLRASEKAVHINGNGNGNAVQIKGNGNTAVQVDGGC